MDAKTFLAEFGHIANAPDGVIRLRELIYQLAISGRFVPHEDSKEVVDHDLATALNYKQQYVAELNLRKTKAHPDLSDSEIPFAIPEHWIWERLENIACYIQRGKSPKYDDNGDTIVVSQKCIQWSGFDISKARKITNESTKKYGKERFLVEGDLLWNSTGTGTVGRVSIVGSIDDKSVVADSHVTVIRLSNFLPKYLFLVIASPGIQTRINPEHEYAIVSGSTKQVELATGTVKALLIPCPPINEQKRIIMKVDELMMLCDKLETQQQQRSKLNKLARTVALESLADAQTSEELSHAWKRLSNNYQLIVDMPESTNEIREAIYQLAIAGKLTIQIANESSGQYLNNLKKIKNELVINKIIKKSKNLGKITEPFNIPKNWSWVHLQDLAINIHYGYTAKGLENREGVKLLRITDIQDNKVNWNAVPACEINNKQLESNELSNGDLLIARTGGTIGKTYLVENLNTVAVFASYLIRFIPLKTVNSEYVKLFTLSPFYWKQLYGAASGTGQPNVNATSLKGLFVPLPPPEEQERIVAKVKKLINHCDDLQHQLDKANAMASNFAKTAVANFTGTEIEEKEKMKAPKTELVSQLRLNVSPANDAQAPLSAILTKHNGELSAKALWNYSGLDIQDFYRQLKIEMAQRWIVEPEKAAMRELEAG